jgi:hypothetical protein
MVYRLSLLVFGAVVLSAQAPNLSGVWKADLEKSKFAGPPPANYLMVIDQQGSTLKETTAATSRMGEYRSSAKYNTSGEESRNIYRGLGMKSKANWDGNTLVVESTVPGEHPANIREKYTLGSDGKTLTIETTTNANGKETTQTAVLEKQPDEAGEALKKPEPTAAEHYKNIQLLKDVPSSQFIDTMRYFSASLGVRCEHCHVEGHFDSDEKQEKLFARKMISMTRSIDDQTFEGHPEVRCYTCHRGSVKPISMPQ